jgi:hypothetical protein
MPAPEIIGKSWEQFLEDFRKEWKPGQHLAIIAPTGQEKTTVLCSLLDLRNFVLAFDPKGGDDTLEKTRYPRLRRWPPPGRDYDHMAEGKAVRYIVGRLARSREEKAGNRVFLSQSLQGALEDGGWTVAIDEFQLASDPRFMNLAADAEEGLISARRWKTSMVTLFQQPSHVSTAAYRMASYVFVGLSLDIDTINRLAEITGRSKPEMRGAVAGLSKRDYSWLVLPNNPRKPIVVTLPTEASKRPRVHATGSGTKAAQ